MNRVIGSHPVDGLWAAGNPNGWSFDPAQFGLPNWPIPQARIDMHPQTNAIMAHLHAGGMLGHVDRRYVNGTAVWLQKIQHKPLKLMEVENG